MFIRWIRELYNKNVNEYDRIRSLYIILMADLLLLSVLDRMSLGIVIVERLPAR